MRNTIIWVMAAVLLGTATVGGWQALQPSAAHAASPAEPQQAPKAETSLAERLDHAVKSQEPNWKSEYKFSRREAQRDTSSNGWKSDDHYVNVTTYEEASTEGASALLNMIRKAPTGAPTRATKLDNLADEAYLYTEVREKKTGFLEMLLRCDNVVVALSASSPQLAQRFARHIVKEIRAK